jgi:hypothetical protein
MTPILGKFQLEDAHARTSRKPVKPATLSALKYRIKDNLPPNGSRSEDMTIHRIVPYSVRAIFKSGRTSGSQWPHNLFRSPLPANAYGAINNGLVRTLKPAAFA